MIFPTTSLKVGKIAFGRIVPERILVEYQGPRIFTFRVDGDRLFLAYHCDEENEVWRYTVVPCSELLVEDFMKGKITVSQILGQPWGWIVDIKDGDTVLNSWEVNPRELPSDYQPTQDTYLCDTRNIDLSVRLLGSSQNGKSVSLSAVKEAAERTMGAIRGLAEYVSIRNNLKTFGSKQARDFADVPVSGVMLASFEIDVSLPSDDKLKSLCSDAEEAKLVSDSVKILLVKAVVWASKDTLPNESSDDNEENIAILRALQEFTPTGRSDIGEVQLGGKIVESHSKRIVSLRSHIRPAIRNSINRSLANLGDQKPKSLRWPDLITAVGTISMTDKTASVFYLKEFDAVYLLDEDNSPNEIAWPYGDIISFTFDSKWKNAVNNAFHDDVKVSVIGKLTTKYEKPEGTIYTYQMQQYNLIDLTVVQSPGPIERID